MQYVPKYRAIPVSYVVKDKNVLWGLGMYDKPIYDPFLISVLYSSDLKMCSFRRRPCLAVIN